MALPQEWNLKEETYEGVKVKHRLVSLPKKDSQKRSESIVFMQQSTDSWII